MKLKSKVNHTISDYFNRIPTFASIALSKDGSRLAYQSSITGSPQIWIGDVPKSDGLLIYPKPLTSGTEEQPYVLQNGGLEWIGNDQLACVMNRDGDEQTFIRIHNLKSGMVEGIPTQEGAKDSLGFVSVDLKTLHFTSNRDNPVAQGLYTYSLTTHKIEKWYQHESQSCSWLGKNLAQGQFLFIRIHGNQLTTLHMIHPKTKKVTDLFTEPGTLMIPVGPLSRNEILVATNHRRQFIGMAKLDLKTKTLDYMGPDQWDIEYVDLSPDKKYLLANRNVAGRSQLELYLWPSLKRQTLNAPNKGFIDSMSFSQNSQFVVFSHASPVNPRDFFRLSLKTKKVQQLTDNWTSRLSKKEFIQPQSIQFQSKNRKVYSWLFLPRGAKKNKTTPVIFWPHGGPQAQERAQFRPIFQYFVGRGFAVWAPNPTGSTGFGKDFSAEINGQWGTADLPDVVNGLEWLKSSGWIDPSRIAVMGGSYGGYMTLRVLTRLPGVFRAGVDIFGVCNLLTFVNSVPPDWRPYMDLMVGHSVRDEAKLRKQSPLFEIEKIDCPLLVIQGAKDPRVVKAESDQVVETLRGHGREVEYLVFEDEGHGFLKLENELKAYKSAATFLEKHL